MDRPHESHSSRNLKIGAIVAGVLLLAMVGVAVWGVVGQVRNQLRFREWREAESHVPELRRIIQEELGIDEMSFEGVWAERTEGEDWIYATTADLGWNLRATYRYVEEGSTWKLSWISLEEPQECPPDAPAIVLEFYALADALRGQAKRDSGNDDVRVLKVVKHYRGEEPSITGGVDSGYYDYDLESEKWMRR